MTWLKWFKKTNDADKIVEDVATIAQWHEAYRQERERITALSGDEARREAEVLLADPQKFQCVPSPLSDDVVPDELALGLRSLFARFESIRAVDNDPYLSDDAEAFLDRQDIVPFDWDGDGLSWGQPLWKIGQPYGGAVALVKPGEESVYDVFVDNASTNYELESHPSVYHWLLMVAWVASDFGID